MKDLHAALRDYMRQQCSSDSAHDLGHLDRVWRNARIIAADEADCDQIVVLAACYLHDLVNLPKDHPDRTSGSALSAAAAAPVMQKFGLTKSQIRAAQHAILTHSFSANVAPETIEAKIVQDADRIDALGAVGLARCFAVSGALERPLFNSEDPFATQRPLDDKTYAIDHFAQKLLRLPGMMQTDGGKTLAEQRAALLRSYLTDLAEELEISAPDW